MLIRKKKLEEAEMSAGTLFIPEELTFPTASTTPGTSEEFLEALMKAMTEPLKDSDSAGCIVPHISLVSKEEDIHEYVRGTIQRSLRQHRAQLSP